MKDKRAVKLGYFRQFGRNETFALSLPVALRRFRKHDSSGRLCCEIYIYIYNIQGDVITERSESSGGPRRSFTVASLNYELITGRRIIKKLSRPLNVPRSRKRVAGTRWSACKCVRVRHPRGLIAYHPAREASALIP